MKRHGLLLSLIALPFFQTSALDLTPRWIDTAIDSVPKRQLYFADGDKKFMLSIDRETEVAARFGGTNFRFPKFSDIDFLILPSRLNPAVPFNEAKLVDYREAARSLLPPRARSVETVEEQSNPIPINQWKSFRVKLRFTMNARAYSQEVTFINVNERDQMVVVTASPERDWAEATERSWQILRSWQEMLPGDEAGPKEN